MAEYKTIEKQASDEFVEKKSRFIGHIKPVSTEQEAIDFINEKKTKHWDATHNVYAYSLRESNVKRYSDDGEPSGTAGIPVLEVLNKSGLVDCVAVVTRYFGGTMLGAGGLVRAYSHGAKIAVDAGIILTMKECIIAEFVCSYNQYGKLSSLVPSFAGVVDNTIFTDNVTIKFHMEKGNEHSFQKQLDESTCGEVKITVTGTEFFKIK